MVAAPNSVISDEAELLYRQVHPNFYHKKKPASYVFRPNAADNGHLSVDRSSLTSAKESFERYTQRLTSAAVYAVSVGEFASQTINCYSHPIIDPPNASHALADYSHLSEIEAKTAALQLRNFADARGCCFPID
jgi:hypothetical protein